MPDDALYCGCCGNSVDNPATFLEPEPEPPFKKWRIVSSVVSIIFGGLPCILGVMSVINGIYDTFLWLFVGGLFALISAGVSIATSNTTNVIAVSTLPVFYAVAAVGMILAQSPVQGMWFAVCAIMAIVVTIKTTQLNKPAE